MASAPMWSTVIRISPSALLGAFCCSVLVACGAKVVLEDDDGVFHNEGAGGAGQGDAGGSISAGGFAPGCDADLPGSVMVEIEAPGWTYCIDAYEATRRDYLAFLKSVTEPPDPACSGASHVPTQGWPPDETTMDLPVGGVHYCDAKAYCKWAGKRLCGGFNGESSPRPDPSIDEWAFACSAGGTQTYPYGDTFDPEACNESSDGPMPVGRPTCEGGFPGIYDMVGNVMEWGRDCNPEGFCHLRGGSFFPAEDGSCNQATITTTIGAAGTAIGFRCCRDAE